MLYCIRVYARACMCVCHSTARWRGGGDDRRSAVSAVVRLRSALATPPGLVSLAHDFVLRGSVPSSCRRGKKEKKKKKRKKSIVIFINDQRKNDRFAVNEGTVTTVGR